MKNNFIEVIEAKKDNGFHASFTLFALFLGLKVLSKDRLVTIIHKILAVLVFF